LRKVNLILFVLLTVSSLLFAQETEVLFNKKEIETFIQQWDNIHIGIDAYSEKNPQDEYFQKIGHFLFSVTDLTIFMLGYSDQALDDAVKSSLNTFKEIIQYRTSPDLQQVFIDNGIKTGEKIYFELLLAATLIGIEKRALFERSKPNNDVEIEPILRNTRAFYSLYNKEDIRLVNELFYTLPKEINRYYYNIE
jgi:hypothetical protein